MNTEQLKQLFANNSDCYADTWHYPADGLSEVMIEGEVVHAMTEEKFVEVVSELLSQINSPK